MKIAIQLYGQPRYVKDSFEYGWKNISEQYNVDFYIHTWFDNTGQKNKLQHYLLDNKQVSDDITVETLSTIQNLFNPVAFRYDAPPDFNKIMHPYTNKQSRIEQAIYGQHLSAYFANELRRNSGKKYDIIIKSRIDIIIENLKLYNIEKNTISVPYVFNEVLMNPIADHWAIGDEDAITKYCDVIKHIDYFLSNGATLQSEFLIHLHLIKENIKINRIPQPYLITRQYLEQIGSPIDFSKMKHIDHFDVSGKSNKLLEQMMK